MQYIYQWYILLFYIYKYVIITIIKTIIHKCLSAELEIVGVDSVVWRQAT